MPKNITQYKVYDMDNDGRDDIVVLTEAGNLSILYGTATPGAFEMSVIENNLGITLSDTPQKI